ncbi:MAG: helix-hairpin-helix domain-containing protein [Anaerolineae bacterium]
MKLIDRYPGGQDPFEGDHTVTLRSLPDGARVTKASLTLTPAKDAAGAAPTETILFDDTTGVGSRGATRDPAALGSAFWAAANLNARRNISAVIAAREPVSPTGTGASAVADGGQVSVQMDIGGTWMGVAADGTLEAPGKPKLILNLPLKPAAGQQPAPTSLPPLATGRLKLTAMSSPTAVNDHGQVSLYGVVVSATASNISVRLGQLPPFWTRPGDLGGAATSPDFAAVLNAFLADAQAQDGFYSVPFTIHSDSLARLDVDVSIDFVVEQPVLPPHLPEATASFGASTLPSLATSLTTVTLPRQAVPVTGRSSAQIQGQFQSTRVAAGPIGDTPPVLPVEVAPTRSLAQAILLDQETHVLAVDVPLSSPQAILTGMHIAFQTDDDGKPSGDVLPGGDGQPATAEVRVDRPLPNQSSWGTATFRTPVRLQAAQRYWLVLQSTDGRAFWDAIPGAAQPPALLAPPLVSSDDGGLSWRAAAVTTSTQPLAALIRLRTQVDHFTIPVQLQIGSGPNAVRRKLNEFDPLGRVEFTFDFAEAMGAHLATQVAAAPCAAGELLVNGSFDTPPPDDAARRLLGFDAASDSAIAGTVNLSQGVNLSVQRYITLGVDGSAPHRIDCAGAVPARTTITEVVAAINRAFGGQRVASEDGGILFLASPSDTGGRVDLLPWRPDGPPQGWQQIGGSRGGSGGVVSISRLRLPIRRPPVSNGVILATQNVADRIVAALESNAIEAATLAQTVSVGAGCVYALRCQFASLRLGIFSGLASRNEPPTLGGWEVHWLSATGQEIRLDSGTLDVADEGVGFAPFEVRLTAPDGAVRAEVRFIQAPPGILLLDDVSFAATFDRVFNATFGLWQAAPDNVGPREPQGWSLESGNVVQTQDGAKLISDMQDDAVLTQTVAVKGGQTHSLIVQASPSAALDDPDSVAATARARVELRWLGDGAPPAPVVIPLDGRDFSIHSWVGAAPAGAKQAEIRLIQPAGGGSLALSQAGLTELDAVQVPLTFLSETPGELTLSKLRVAYDLPSAAPTARPANGFKRAALGTRELGLAPAAPPGPLAAPAPLTAPPIAPTPVEPVAPAAPPAPPLTEAVAAPAETREVTVPAPPAVPLAETAEPAPGPAGLIDVKGIGPARVRQLTESGITNLADLAAATPQDIVTRLRGVTQAAAEDYIRQARELVATAPPQAPSTPPAPPAVDLPLTLVSGLGAARVARLSDVGIDTVQKLAEAAPDDVARVLRGVSLETAAHFIEAARQVLEANAGGSP